MRSCPAFAVLLGVLVASQVASAAEPAAAIARKTRRILYNLDGDSCMWTKKDCKGPVRVAPDDLKTVVEEIAGRGSQVDSLLVCVNAQCMYYPTRIGDMRGTLATPAQRANWPVSEQWRMRNMEAMFQQGVDPYALLLAEARRRGMEALLTYRMNDIHDGDFLNHRFWLEHPERRLAGPVDKGFRPGLDFAHDTVREYTFRLIEEAVQRYDCDGIELDFNRAPLYFRKGSEGEGMAKINDLVRRVRRMLDAQGQKRNRRLVLAARVLPMYSDSRALGLDPAAWAKDRLIDFLSVSTYTYAYPDYVLPIKPWKSLIPSIPIYGGCDSPKTAEHYRSVARHFWRDGADGIYLFNFFTAREDGIEPPFGVLKELGDPRQLQQTR